FVLIVEGVRKPLRQLPRMMIVDVDQRRHAVALGIEGLGSLSNAGAREIANCFRAVLVAAGLNDAGELGHELVVDGNRHALHGRAERSREGQQPRSLHPTVSWPMLQQRHGTATRDPLNFVIGFVPAGTKADMRAWVWNASGPRS